LVLTICRHSAATPLVGRPTPVSYLFSLSRLALLPRAPPLWGGAARTERMFAASPSWREDLCVTRTRPHALCVPRPFAFLFDRLSPGSPWRRFRLSSAFRLLLKPFIFPFGRRVRVTPFASLIISFRLLLKQFIFSTPSAGVESGHAVRVCALRARPRTSTRFAFQTPVPVHAPSPFR